MSSDSSFRPAPDADVVPDGAKAFVKQLQRALRSAGTSAAAAARKEKGGRGELVNLYESEFPKLTERYFKASSWPTAEQMGEIIDDGADNNNKHHHACSFHFSPLFFCLC
jgi:hypothetical protein